MRKFIIYPIVLFVICSCNDDSKTAGVAVTDTKASDMKAVYEKNLASLKTAVAAIEKEDVEGWANGVADSVVFTSPMYGDTLKTKQHWKDFLSGFIADWDSLKLVDPIFLPGIDSETHEFDGSARYYGTWTGVHKSGKHTSFKFYGTFEFNKDGKIIDADEFFDVGGIFNSIVNK